MVSSFVIIFILHSHTAMGVYFFLTARILLSHRNSLEYWSGYYRSQWPICAGHSEARRSVLFRFGRILLGQSQGGRAIERSFAPLCIRGLANEIRSSLFVFHARLVWSSRSL
jgi:hypothetical protein